MKLNVVVLIAVLAFSGVIHARECTSDLNNMDQFPGGLEIKGTKAFSGDREIFDGDLLGQYNIAIKRDSSKRPVSVGYKEKLAEAKANAYSMPGDSLSAANAMTAESMSSGSLTFDYSSGKCQIVREIADGDVIYDRSLCKDLMKLSKELGADFNRCNDLLKKAGERVEKFQSDLAKQNLKFAANPTVGGEKPNKGQLTLKAFGNCEMMESGIAKRRTVSKSSAATPAAPAKSVQ